MRDSPKLRLVALITFDSQDAWISAELHCLSAGYALFLLRSSVKSTYGEYDFYGRKNSATVSRDNENVVELEMKFREL